MILLVVSLITLLSVGHSAVDTFHHDIDDTLDRGADDSLEIIVMIISKTYQLNLI